MCCGVLRFVAVCCSMLQCVAVCCSVLQYVAACCSALHCAALCCSVLQCVTVYCSVLQCVAVCCSVLQCVADLQIRRLWAPPNHRRPGLICLCVAMCWSYSCGFLLQYVAVFGNNAVRCSMVLSQYIVAFGIVFLLQCIAVFFVLSHT